MWQNCIFFVRVCVCAVAHDPKRYLCFTPLSFGRGSLFFPLLLLRGCSLVARWFLARREKSEWELAGSYLNVYFYIFQITEVAMKTTKTEEETTHSDSRMNKIKIKIKRNAETRCEILLRFYLSIYLIHLYVCRCVSVIIMIFSIRSFVLCWLSITRKN